MTSTDPAEPARAESRDAEATAAQLLQLLRDGELEPIGWLVGSSNNAMVVRVTPGDLLGVWKPTAGERPLFDFPLGTLTRREVAAYLVSEALGWGIVPPTLLRDGPHGEGMLQRWIDVDESQDVIDMVNGDDPRLRRIAVFDAIVNNTDRKAGHLLPVPGGHLYAVDHGVTFSIDPKLRTVLWAWEGEPFEQTELEGLARVRNALASGAAPGPLARALAELLFVGEIEATRTRVAELLATGRFPSPNPEWPAIPWPPY
ncbi:MAG: SCO1664 family protein [Chloroflexota bacterium]